MRLLPIGILAALVAGTLGCRDDSPGGLSVIEEPPKEECNREIAPRTYEIYFVIDVSGSMGPFLNDVKQELVALSANFPKYDADGRRTRVDYYVVAFVNDVKWFPTGAERMTSHIHVQDAFEQAIAAGAAGKNLTQDAINAEAKENLLDAISEVLARNSEAEAKLMLIATDADFADRGDVLSTQIEVESSYASVLADLESQEFRVHAFTQSQLDGLTRTYRNMPPLTSVAGSSKHDLADLTGSRDQIRETLTEIAENADCN